MRFIAMFITAVCVLFLTKLRYMAKEKEYLGYGIFKSIRESVLFSSSVESDENNNCVTTGHSTFLRDNETSNGHGKSRTQLNHSNAANQEIIKVRE